MDFELKFKGIAVRWFLNVFLIIAIIVTVFAAFALASYRSLYQERIKTVADDYAYEFETLADCDAERFEDVAVSLAEAFPYKNKVEVQVLNNDGKVFVSTTGFEPAAEDMPDYERALKSDKHTASFRGKNAGGEDVYACTTILFGEDNAPLGAYRWIVSYRATNHRILGFTWIVFGLCIGILGISVLSGLFFIKSIVRPIRAASNTARKIAAGELDSQIEIRNNDEIGELCDTINYMASELKQAEEMKNDFISSVSHELRTPLTAIRGWGETAKMSLGSDDALVDRGLDVVLAEAERLSGLVEELLDFSRMQNGRLTVNTCPIDVSELLNMAVDMYIELARQQGIELSYMPPSRPSVVMGDADRLKQVFINIIDNAVKYTEKGGLVLVVQNREEGCVRIQVKDTGVGIPAQDIDRVKEKFFKSNKTVRGSGIGLAVADEIIRQHQGLLFIESTEGVGTTVTIVLPLYEEPEPPAEELTAPETDGTEDTAAEEPALPVTDGAEQTETEPAPEDRILEEIIEQSAEQMSDRKEETE